MLWLFSHIGFIAVRDICSRLSEIFSGMNICASCCPVELSNGMQWCWWVKAEINTNKTTVVVLATIIGMRLDCSIVSAGDK